jgi:hypothetical protein
VDAAEKGQLKPKPVLVVIAVRTHAIASPEEKESFLKF